MGRKKKQKQEVSTTNPEWTITESIRINGRLVEPKTELSIKGESGRFLFIKHVKTPTTEWIDVVGGKAGYKMLRSFSLEKVKTVHYKNRVRGNVESSSE